MTIQSLMRQVHLWMGLSLGALFVLAGITGAILVFYVEIDAALHPPLDVGPPTDPAPVLDAAYATVRQAYPDKAGPWRFELTGTMAAIPARYYDPPERAGQAFAPMLVWLSPDGRQVLRRDYWGDTVMTFLYDLHYRLLMGKTGAVVMGCAGLAMLVLLVTGLWAWWPAAGRFAKALRYKPAAVPLRRLRDLHKLTGLISLLLLVLLVGTGVMLSLPQQSNAVLGWLLAPVDVSPPVRAGPPTGRAPVPPQRALALALAALPGSSARWIETPDAVHGVYTLRMQVPGDPSPRFPHSFVHVDAYDGRVLAAVDARQAGPATAVNNWLHPLHDGSVLGLATRWLAVLAGLVPLALYITGILRWRLRVARQG